VSDFFQYSEITKHKSMSTRKLQWGDTIVNNLTKEVWTVTSVVESLIYDRSVCIVTCGCKSGYLTDESLNIKLKTEGGTGTSKIKELPYTTLFSLKLQ